MDGLTEIYLLGLAVLTAASAIYQDWRALLVLVLIFASWCENATFYAGTNIDNCWWFNFVSNLSFFALSFSLLRIGDGYLERRSVIWCATFVALAAIDVAGISISSGTYWDCAWIASAVQLAIVYLGVEHDGGKGAAVDGAGRRAVPAHRDAGMGLGRG
jgi:hypothetical protein